MPRVSERPVHVLDGARFDDLSGFFDEVERVLKLGSWGRNLDALNDVLRGRPMTLRWTHAARSRRQLGFDETARWLSAQLPKVHASNRAAFEARLAEARHHRGETLFETVVALIREHGAGGAQADDHVTLELVE